MTKTNGADRDRQDWPIVLPSSQSAVEVELAQQMQIRPAPIRETEFSVLPDGQMVDLVKTIREPSHLEFLVWQDGSIRQMSSLEHNGELLVVPKIDPTVVSALRLPATVEPCPPVRDLIPQLMEAIGTYVDVTKEDNFLIAVFILTTWFADRLSIVPYLSVCGPPDAGQITLLRLLHCLCRRAIHVADITPASLYRLSEQVRPVWLIDGLALDNRNLQRFLRGGNQRGARVLSNGKAYEYFGPKVMVSRVPLEGVALASTTIHIAMSPSSRDLAALDTVAEQKLADAFQPRLEMFRLLHYRAVAASQCPGFSKFPASLRDVARALAAPMLGDEELQARLAGALESQIDSLRFDQFLEPNWVVMLALFNLCHEASYNVYVANLAGETNRIFRQNGETLPYSAKMVGRILNKSLGFKARRRGEGFRIVLTLDVRTKIHRQAHTMGMKRSDVVPATNVASGFVDLPCSLCTQFGLMVDHEGRRLEPISEFMGGDPFIQCTNCGGPLRPDDTHCPRCDTPLQSAEPPRNRLRAERP